MIAAIAVGATQGYIYLRSEYPNAGKILQRAVEIAYQQGYLGRNFDLEIRVGAGAYICGEETALLESLEGKRGMIRYKPPLPAVKGLFGQPTVVNNVITLATVPFILAQGADAYQKHGAGKSRGTLTIQLAGNVKHPGLYEVDFGLPLRELLYDIGGGTATGRPIKTVQCGGPLGAYLHESQFGLPVTYEDFAGQKAMVGHGGVVVFDDTVNMAEQARYAMEFCAVESCGKCTPCRIGSVRGVEVIEKIIAGKDPVVNQGLLEELCETMMNGSLCAMGGLTPSPVLSALKFWPEDFGLAPKKKAA
jgi:formate dehydrogenase iron-sulfur subunit